MEGWTLILRSILLKNFRSIGENDGAGVEIPLARINYIIGPNGAGKSNIVAGLEAIAAIFAGRTYEPKPVDHFDRDPARAMELGATMEMSDEERLRFLSSLAAGSETVSTEDAARFPALRTVSYSVVFANDKRQSEKISIDINDGASHTLSEACRDEEEMITVKVASLKMSDQKNEIRSLSSSDKVTQFPSTHELVGYAHPFLLGALKRHFDGFRMIDTDRKIAASVPAREPQGVSPDGGNLPAELDGLGRDMQTEFDEYMRAITHGDPVGVEPHLRKSEFVLKIKEAGLGARGTHTDLGSGQEQSLILGWHMFNASGTILIVREPELHMHAERQKQILRLIRRDDHGLQFVIETHSPIFLGTRNDENVLLVKKSEGRTCVAKIAPENMRLIREELGISHADALYNTRVLFVEGESEFAAFPVFWKALRPDLGPAPTLFSLGGAGNTKHLRLILEYLKDDDRRFFAILDRHDDAVAHAKNLPPALLPSDSLHILKKSFEDEFTGDQISRAANNLAKKAGLDLRLTPEELDAAGRKGAMIKAVKRRWFEVAATPLNKADLATELARLCGREIPAGIRAALEAAAASLGRPDPAGSESEPTATSGGLT